MGAGRQLRQCSIEIKDLGLRMNEFLYEGGNVRKGKMVPKSFKEEDIPLVLAELEKVRQEVWWIYNYNKEFAEDTGYIID